MRMRASIGPRGLFPREIDFSFSVVQYCLDVRWHASILLLFAFAAVGTGTLDFVHRHLHEQRESIADTKSQRHHDENDCEICLMLHAPILSGGYVPVLVSLGLFVAFLTLVAPRLLDQADRIRITCRGPPLFAPPA